MKTMSGGQQYIAATLFGAIFLGAMPASAQESGLGVAATLTPGILYEDERLRASLNFGAQITAATRNQRLALDFNGALESERGGSFSDSLRDPRLELSYGLESRQSELEANISYRRARISSLVFDDDLTNDLLVIDDGRREDLNLSTALTFGREASFGGTVDLGYSQRTYLDTTDPGLEDEETRRAGVVLRFEIDKRSTVTVSGRISENEVQETGSEQKSENLTIGVEQAVTPTLVVSAGIGASRITDTIQATREGASYTLSAVQEQPNGTLSGRISSDITAGGRVSTARIERRLELPLGSLSLALGVGQAGDSTPQPLASLSWLHEMPRATFALALDQAIAVDREGERAVNSRISLNWQQELDSLTNLSAGLSLRETDRLGIGNPDSQQASISLSVQRTLTQDWALRSSYIHRRSRVSGSSESSEDTFFLGVERGFQWRP